MRRELPPPPPSRIPRWLEIASVAVVVVGCVLAVVAAIAMIR
jgi:hypothetical protein